MRGRLIHKFLARLLRVDRAATGDTPAAGAGFNPFLQEPVRISDGQEQFGVSSRQEKDAVDVPCQVNYARRDPTRMTPVGADVSEDLSLIFHFADLERLGLVKATGEADVGPGDRVSVILDRDGATVQEYPDPPGLYVVEATPHGFGLAAFGKATRNLLRVRVAPREQHAQGAA